jgi:predicted DNA-binding protein (MmcQ/YjbR family)
MDAQLVDDLVTESYLLVVEGLPRSRRPVDPGSFRRSARLGG